VGLNLDDGAAVAPRVLRAEEPPRGTGFLRDRGASGSGTIRGGSHRNGKGTLMTRRLLLSLPLAAVLLVLGAFAQARPNYRSALATFVGKPLPEKLNDCRTCHVVAAGADPSRVNGRSLNVYGQRLRKALPELRAAKKRAGIRNRLEAVADEDADGDGASNGDELLSGHFPGDARDTPTAEERERARKAR
jgi:hypothetical protein